MNNYKIDFNPKSEQFSEIEKWLLDEERKYGKGFYCNIKDIENSFYENEVIVISKNEEVIGFLTWSEIYDKKVAKIEIAEIKLSQRGKGTGKVLVNQTLDFLKKKGFFVVELECAPAESEVIWKHMGFVRFPVQLQENNTNKRLYKILVNSLKESSLEEKSEIIKLWNNEPYIITKEQEPYFIWNLSFRDNTRELMFPIIKPASYKWKIQWKKNEKTIIDKQVRYFFKRIDFGDFIIIEEL